MNDDQFLTDFGFGTLDIASQHYRNCLEIDSNSSNNLRIVGNPVRKTGESVIDIKLSEARQCLSLGLPISAITMICVTLEESLKTLIKYKTIHHKNQGTSKLEALEAISLETEADFGGISLGPAIKKAFELKIITEDEKKVLTEIKDSVRNSFIHSDKSKILTEDKNIPVQTVTFDQDQVKMTDDTIISGLGFLFAHGILQRKFAGENAESIVNSIYNLIIKIVDRFYEDRRKEKQIVMFQVPTKNDTQE